jgi:HD-GYP domain-containing protein (c-di-GMP phosphodiesterase class II)
MTAILAETVSSCMPQQDEVSMAELLSSLSYALDMTEGQPPGHCIRACWIGMQIGQEYGLKNQQLWELYYTILLKDLGCSSNAARICELYATDDLNFKHNFKTIDNNSLRVLMFIMKNTGADKSLGKRISHIIETIKHGGEWATEVMETRCERGADIASDLGFNDEIAQGIRRLDEHWNGGGKPYGLKGDTISIYARIALLAQVIDVCNSATNSKDCLAEVKKRSGTWFDPALVNSFLRVVDEQFWQTLHSENLPEIVIDMEPAQYAVTLDDNYIKKITTAFGKIIDSKSPYTAGHSTRVATIVERLAVELNYPAEKMHWLTCGALLHDVGKLGVSNRILDKPGKLSDEEYSNVKNHALFTGEILSRIGAFGMLAEIAQAHHERLDGQGYPLGMKAEEISLDTRLITVADIFDAISAERPYRGATPVDKTLDIMRETVDVHIDRQCFEVLCDLAHDLPHPDQ